MTNATTFLWRFSSHIQRGFSWNFSLRVNKGNGKQKSRENWSGKNKKINVLVSRTNQMIQFFLITVFWHDLHQGNILLSTPTTLMLIFYPLSLFEFRLGLNWAGSKKAVYKLRCNNRSSSTWKLFAIRKSIPNLFQCKRTALDARRITQVYFYCLYAADLSEPLTPFRSPSNLLLPQLCGQLLTPY